MLFSNEEGYDVLVSEIGMLEDITFHRLMK